MRRLVLAFTLAIVAPAAQAEDLAYPSEPTSSPEMTTSLTPPPPAPTAGTTPPPPTPTTETTPPRAVVVVIGNPGEANVDPTGEIDLLHRKGYVVKTVWNPTYADLDHLPNDAIVVIVAHLTDADYPGAPPAPMPGPWYQPGDYYFWGKDGAPSKPAKHVLDCLDDHPAVYVCSCYSTRIEHLESNVHGLAPGDLHSEEVPEKLDELIPPASPQPPSGAG